MSTEMLLHDCIVRLFNLYENFERGFLRPCKLEFKWDLSCVARYYKLFKAHMHASVTENNLRSVH